MLLSKPDLMLMDDTQSRFDGSSSVSIAGESWEGGNSLSSIFRSRGVGHGSIMSLSSQYLLGAADGGTSNNHHHHQAAFFALDDAEIQKCLDCMNFIPTVDTAVQGAAATLRLQARSTLITPIFTACYNRHGGSALVAVEGLHSLLTKTDFFEDDIGGWVSRYRADD